MKQRILFIGGEQDGAYGFVRENINQIKLDVYPKIDLKTVSGIVEIGKVLRTEIYHRKKIDNIECFVLREIIDK